MIKKFKNWLINNFLPIWAREQMIEENRKLMEENLKLKGQIERLNAYIDGLETGIKSQRRMLTKDARGNKVFKDHTFVGLDEDPETVGVTIFSPALREQSFLARKQEYLRNVENVIGLKRGLLSEVEAAERTATEITSSEGEYNLTVIDFQQMWEKTVREAVRVCGTEIHQQEEWKCLTLNGSGSGSRPSRITRSWMASRWTTPMPSPITVAFSLPVWWRFPGRRTSWEM